MVPVTSPKTLGKVLRRYRNDLGLTQSEAGRKFNLPQKVVSQVEAGRDGTHIATIFRYMSALGLEMHLEFRNKSSSSEADNLVVGENLVISGSELGRLVKAHHIKRLALFGSAARGELKPDSDIDLLLEFEESKTPTLGGMVRINDDFSTLFGGRRVDIATSSILNNPYRRREIEKDMEEIYAA